MAEYKNVINVGDEMVTPRYHYGTIISIFLALGLGILLGGSLGQQWLSEQQQDLLDKLEERYEETADTNQQLEQQIKVLEEQSETSEKDRDNLWHEGLKDVLKEEKILFLKDADGQFSPTLLEALQLAGSTVQLSNIMDIDQTKLQDINMVVLHPQLLQEETYQWILRDVISTQALPIILLNEKKIPSWLITENLQSPQIIPIDLSKMEERLGALSFVRIAEHALDEARAVEESLVIEEEVTPDEQ